MSGRDCKCPHALTLQSRRLSFVCSWVARHKPSRSFPPFPVNGYKKCARQLTRTPSAVFFFGFSVGSTPQPQPFVSPVPGKRSQKVRTTAYTHSERGGKRNALGTYLSGRSEERRVGKECRSRWSP